MNFIGYYKRKLYLLNIFFLNNEHFKYYYKFAEQKAGKVVKIL